jgi:hypothetical protein
VTSIGEERLRRYVLQKVILHLDALDARRAYTEEGIEKEGSEMRHMKKRRRKSKREREREEKCERSVCT